MVNWLEDGTVFRSGCCWRRGDGRIFTSAPITKSTRSTTGTTSEKSYATGPDGQHPTATPVKSRPPPVNESTRQLKLGGATRREKKYRRVATLLELRCSSDPHCDVPTSNTIYNIIYSVIIYCEISEYNTIDPVDRSGSDPGQRLPPYCTPAGSVAPPGTASRGGRETLSRSPAVGIVARARRPGADRSDRSARATGRQTAPGRSAGSSPPGARRNRRNPLAGPSSRPVSEGGEDAAGTAGVVPRCILAGSAPRR